MLQPEWLRHDTVEDYRRWEGDWELIAGIPYAMSPSPTFRDQQVSGEIHARIRAALRSCPTCTAVYETDWIVAEDTVVRPDLAVYCDPVDADYPRLPPRLVVEILSPTTRTKDKGLKRALYGKQGVRHYLLVDPDTLETQWPERHGGRLEARPFPADGVLRLDLGPCTVNLEPSGLPS